MSRKELLEIVNQVDKGWYGGYGSPIREIKAGILFDDLKDKTELDKKLDYLKTALDEKFQDDNYVESIMSSMRNLIKNEKDKDTQIKSPSDSKSNLSSGEGGTGNGSEDDIENPLSKYVDNVENFISQGAMNNNIWKDVNETLRFKFLDEYKELAKNSREYKENNNSENKIKLEKAINDFYSTWNRIIDNLPKPTFLSGEESLSSAEESLDGDLSKLGGNLQSNQEIFTSDSESNLSSGEGGTGNGSEDDIENPLSKYVDNVENFISQGAMNNNIWKDVNETLRFKFLDEYKELAKNSREYKENNNSENKIKLEKAINDFYSTWNRIIDNLPKPTFLSGEESLSSAEESLDGDLSKLGGNLQSNQEISASDSELLEFIQKAIPFLKHELTNNSLLSEGKGKVEIDVLINKLERIQSNKKIAKNHAQALLNFFKNYPELAKQIEHDEDMINKIKNRLSNYINVEPKRGNEKIGKLIDDLLSEMSSFNINNSDLSKSSDIIAKIAVLAKLSKKMNSGEVLNSNDLNNLKNIFKFVEENITNSKIITEENKKIIDEIDKSLKHDSESNDQLVGFISAMLSDLEDIKNNTEIMANNQDDYNAALSFISNLGDLRKKAVENELETEDIKTISEALQFIQRFENEHVEELKINKDEFKSIKGGYKLVGLIGAMQIDLENIKNNTEIMANNQDAFDTALNFMLDLDNDNLIKKAAKNKLAPKDFETISEALKFIQSFENECVKDLEINKDEFKDCVNEFKERVLYDDLVSFIDDAVKKIDVESNNVRGAKKFNLNKASNDLDKLSEKIKNGTNITDRDVRKFRKVLNNDNVQDILGLQDEEKERYIKILESLRDKEKSNEIDEQQKKNEAGAKE